MINFLTLKAETRWLLGEPNSSNTRFTSTDNGDKFLARAINEAYLQTMLAHPWDFRVSVSETITTVLGQRNYCLPFYTGPVIMLRDTSNDRQLRIREERSYYQSYPDSTKQGKATDYFFLGISQAAEPAVTASAYTMDATTSTGSVVDSQPTGATANYYKDWMLYNITRDTFTRITASSVALGVTTLTLEDAITSQVAGDTYVLRKRLLVVALDPIPDANGETIVVHNLILPKPMVNDYDVPMLPHGYELLPAYGAASKMMEPDNPDQAKRYLDRYNGLYNSMYYAFYRSEIDSLPEIPVTNEQAFAGYS